jgi:hypothetical protein
MSASSKKNPCSIRRKTFDKSRCRDILTCTIWYPLHW